MGIFDFLKKTETAEAAEITEHRKKQKNLKQCMYWCSRFVPDEGNESIIDCWELEGTLKVGDQLQFAIPTKEWKVLVL